MLIYMCLLLLLIICVFSIMYRCQCINGLVNLHHLKSAFEVHLMTVLMKSGVQYVEGRVVM